MILWRKAETSARNEAIDMTPANDIRRRPGINEISAQKPDNNDSDMRRLARNPQWRMTKQTVKSI